VTLPAKPDSKHQAMAKKMSKLSDQQFDKQYMANAGVADHRATVALLKRIHTRATDPDLKALADKLLPTVEQHLSMAQQKK
jgi:putative membrane protein